MPNNEFRVILLMRVIYHYKKECTITYEGVMKQSSATVNALNATLTTITPVLLIEKYISAI